MHWVRIVLGVLGFTLLAVSAAAQQAVKPAPPPVMVAPPVPPVPPVIYVPAPPPIPHFAPPPPDSAAVIKQKLLGAPLYVYSFLEVRRDEMTPKVIEQFYADLATRLDAAGVRSKLHRYDPEAVGEFNAELTGKGPQSTAIPVMRVIYNNRADEQAIGAPYRLIVFPSSYKVVGAWRYYDVRFVLMDTRFNRRLWSYTYSGRHLVLWSNSENAKARSEKILNALFEAMKTMGYL